MAPLPFLSPAVWGLLFLEPKLTVPRVVFQYAKLHCKSHLERLSAGLLEPRAYSIAEALYVSFVLIEVTLPASGHEILYRVVLTYLATIFV